MSKCVLLSIKPQYVAKILNGEKTIEIRKHAIPVGTKVYVYCTKGGYCCFYNKIHKDYAISDLIVFPVLDKEHFVGLNAKVVASFVVKYCCEIIWYGDRVQKASCLSLKDIRNYENNKNKPLYEWGISQLKIFDRPKELKEFEKYGWKFYCANTNCNLMPHTKEECNKCKEIRITKAPQSYCYVEELE